MKDHLGNVRVTFSDLKLQPVQQDSFRLDLLTVNNYYAFGMNEPDRNYSSSHSYRYGYNGMEKDNEIKGEGNSYTTFYRGFDSRTVRWWSLDPKPTASESMYSSMGNNPVLNTDVLGDSAFIYTGYGNEPNRSTSVINGLNSRTTNLSFDLVRNQNENGLFNITVNRLNQNDLNSEEQMLFDLVTDQNVNVNLISLGTIQIIGQNNQSSLVVEGYYGGNWQRSFLDINSQNRNVKESFCAINENVMLGLERVGFLNPGDITVHELVESYISAKNSLGLQEAHDATNGIITRKNEIDYSTNNFLGDKNYDFYKNSEPNTKRTLLSVPLQRREKTYSIPDIKNNINKRK